MSHIGHRKTVGGIATSILFSVFESWYLYQHTIVQGFPLEWISNTFSKATFFNGFLAILAGFAGDIAVDRLGLGPVSPFMIAIPFLVFAFLVIYTTWDENYGAQQINWRSSCVEGLQTILRNPLILMLGLIQSIFEANMYIFVFLWTPVLKPGSPPLGLTFSCFMIAIMVGSSVYSTLLNRFGYKSERILTYCLAIMTVTLFACGGLTNPAAERLSAQPASTSFWLDIRMISTFLCFIALEIAVGMYFPSIGTLRGEIIPEGLRANIMNWYEAPKILKQCQGSYSLISRFRVPLNIITCAALLGIRSSESLRLHQTIFFLCSLSSLLGIILSNQFRKQKEQSGVLKINMKLPDSIGILDKVQQRDDEDLVV